MGQDFTQTFLHIEACTQSERENFYTQRRQTTDTHTHTNKQRLLYKEHFYLQQFFTQTTHKEHFYTQQISTHGKKITQQIFAQRGFYTEKLSCTQ